MKKLTCLLCAFLAVAAYAGIKSVEGYESTAPYLQFTHNEDANTGNITDARHPEQNWLGAQTITLKIDSECDVWLSNYVSSWYWPKPLDALDGNVYDMSAGKYGATDLNTGKAYAGNGNTTTVTYVDDATGVTNQTEGYFLGHFKGGEELSIWMTTLASDGGETVDMTQYVYDGNKNVEPMNPDTSLVSRVDGTKDLAGNVRINFGIESASIGYTGREFVAFGVGGETEPHGQPLPGVAFAGLLAMGSIAAAKKMRKRA